MSAPLSNRRVKVPSPSPAERLGQPETVLGVCQVDWRASEASSTLEAFFCCMERLLGGSDAVALGVAVLSCPAKAKATTGFMLSTIDVGIKIVVPRSFVVS